MISFVDIALYHEYVLLSYLLENYYTNFNSSLYGNPKLKCYSIMLNSILLSVVIILGLTTITLAHKNHNQSNSEAKIEQETSPINQEVL